MVPERGYLFGQDAEAVRTMMQWFMRCVSVSHERSLKDLCLSFLASHILRRFQADALVSYDNHSLLSRDLEQIVVNTEPKSKRFDEQLVRPLARAAALCHSGLL